MSRDPLRLLVVEGNTKAGRDGYREGFGLTPSEAYAATLVELAPDAICDLCFPTDADAKPPDGAGLADYDAVFLTGSALNVYDGGAEIQRQIAFARAVFASGTPMFGSCWGVQLASVAAGGEVRKNPRGREIGVARDIVTTGGAHPLLSGRAAKYDAFCSHLDHVAVPPPGATVLAGNAMSEVQALEIRHQGGLFWGVQYHPEFSFAEMTSIFRRVASGLVREKVFESRDAALRYADDLEAAERDAEKAQALRLGRDILDPGVRRLELSNFLKCVRRD